MIEIVPEVSEASGTVFGLSLIGFGIAFLVLSVLFFLKNDLITTLVGVFLIFFGGLVLVVGVASFKQGDTIHSVSNDSFKSAVKDKYGITVESFVNETQKSGSWSAIPDSYKDFVGNDENGLRTECTVRPSKQSTKEKFVYEVACNTEPEPLK